MVDRREELQQTIRIWMQQSQSRVGILNISFNQGSYYYFVEWKRFFLIVVSVVSTSRSRKLLGKKDQMDFYFSVANEEESIFAGSKLPLMTLYRCMFVCFLQNKSILEAQEQILLSESAVKRIYRYCKYQISISIARQLQHPYTPILKFKISSKLMNPYSLISEGDNTVQTQFWVLGIYERNTGGLQCFVLGNNRTTANITPILTSNVSTHPRNPTIFYTNGAAFYYFVNKRGYERRIFNHSVGFGSGEDTTDHIEFLWSQLKSQRRFNGAINEVSWRVKNRHNHLETLFSNLKRENYQQSNKETLIKYNFSQ